MLITLLNNNNNIIPTSLPKVIVDRGGGGPQWPGYDIVDIQGALASFTEVAGEHPVARAVRRQAHIGQHLDSMRERRERREGAAFMAGAMLAENASQEKIDALLQQIEAMKAPAPVRQESSGIGIGAGLLILGAGVVLGVAIAKAMSKPTKSTKKRSGARKAA